jgi:hypothetical protein
VWYFCVFLDFGACSDNVVFCVFLDFGVCSDSVVFFVFLDFGACSDSVVFLGLEKQKIPHCQNRHQNLEKHKNTILSEQAPKSRKAQKYPVWYFLFF